MRKWKNHLQLYLNLKIVTTGLTRKDKTLDIMVSNFGQYVTDSKTCFPIEGEVEQTSDHKTVLLEALLPRPKAFQSEVHDYLIFTETGTKCFKEKLDKEQWSELLALWPNQDLMAENFQSKLQSLLLSCFSWKRVRRKTADKPWISDAIRCRIKRRKAVFRLYVRNEV